jgi:hypothetical protein
MDRPATRGLDREPMRVPLGRVLLRPQGTAHDSTVPDPAMGRKGHLGAAGYEPAGLCSALVTTRRAPRHIPGLAKKSRADTARAGNARIGQPDRPTL